MSNTNFQTAIVGAAGRVASRVIPLLSDKSPLKLGDLRGSPSATPPIHQMDLMKPETLASFLDGVKTVIHFAIAPYESSGQSPEEWEAYQQSVLQINICGTYNLLEAARAAGVSKVIYISSLTVALGAESNLDENLPPCPVNVYACTKLFGEHLVELYHRTHGVSGISLRLGQPFPIGLPEEDEQRRNSTSPHVYVTNHDIARAVDAALTTDRKDYGVYNVVSPSEGNRASYEKGQEIGFEPKDHWQEWEKKCALVQ